MPITINCQHFRAKDACCTHQAAPRRLFGLPECVEAHPPADARLRGCRLLLPFKKPDGYPPPPPLRPSQRPISELIDEARC